MGAGVGLGVTAGVTAATGNPIIGGAVGGAVGGVTAAETKHAMRRIDNGESPVEIPTTPEEFSQQAHEHIERDATPAMAGAAGGAVSGGVGGVVGTGAGIGVTTGASQGLEQTGLNGKFFSGVVDEASFGIL